MATFTFQTFQQAQQEGRLTDFLWDFIQQHKSSPQVAGRTGALAADLYDRQKNPGAEQFAAAYAEMLKRATNNTRDIMRPDMVKSNLFRRLNKQRAAYSLGNGVTFADDTDKLKLGATFDERVFKAGYFALIHGESFGFWNYDHLDVFKLTELAPLYDEDTGTLRAAARYWQLNPDTATKVVLYEEDGYTEYKSQARGAYPLQEAAAKRGYLKTTITTNVGGEEFVTEDNYGTLPIVPLWGSDLHQSTLVGLKAYIDNTDLVMSGFCNDLQDCAQIYWLCENFGGMTQDELQGFLQQLNLYHVANADTSDGGKVQPYTTEIPVTARSTLLDLLHSRSYEDFGGLDVHCVSADSTNDHLDAAYEPLNHNADDFEAQLTPFIQQICKLAGLGDVSPIFTRSKITNTKEQVDMVLSEAPIIGHDMAIDLLPNLTPEQKERAKAALMAESATRETINDNKEKEDDNDNY